MRSPFRPLLALPLIFACAAAAQQPAAPPAGPATADDPQALMAEYRGLAEQLGRLQARAMEDEELSRRSEQLVEDVEKRMIELEPATTERLAQLEDLKARLEAARQAQDRAAFEESVGQARGVSVLLEGTRSRVLEEEAYARRTAALQEALVAEMTRLEPAVPGMLARLEQLDRRLRGGGN